MLARVLKRVLAQPIKDRLEAVRAKVRVREAERAVANFSRPAALPHGLPGELIISLTSYPPRYPTLAKTLKSLLAQDIRADRTILWLEDKDVPALPEDVRVLTEVGLEIRKCVNIRSYNKLIHTLVDFPEAYVVTADDDVYYPPHWLAVLVEAVKPGETAIICRRAHQPQGRNGQFGKYADWRWEIVTDGELRDDLFPTGVGGVLYPPHSLAPEVTDMEALKRLAPTADDVWLFCMAKRAGTKHRQVGGRFPLVNWEGSQDVGLEHENVLQANDRQLEAVWREYCATPGD
ncbi:glycosyltransferase [Sphingomonas sp. SM33]|uniref:Glycosyltransferase n=1 Tax=Sphingomonas telluris TaxID=2907998 RepID=A0ABS9VI71_9SPHN|nr:glycosyltransferase [Sphingomonas telluris]MCH8614670.1 glycosyltransferase [Sphingomonas telluris]